MTKPTAIGVGWYRREDWGRIRLICPDRDELQDTFDAWEADAEKVARKLKREGFVVARHR
jgi:predicted nucleotidyltransferase